MSEMAIYRQPRAGHLYNPYQMQALWNELFKPDSGMVFEIRAYGITPKDYDRLLPLLIQNYPAVYSEDRETRDLPDFSTISHRRNLVTTTLELNVLNVRVRCWFREDDELDLDLLPDDVDSEAKAEGIFSLMRTISEVLRKRVLLTGENSGATQQWSEEHAIVAFNPPAEF
jgi:hypothetical protein